MECEQDYAGEIDQGLIVEVVEVEDPESAKHESGGLKKLNAVEGVEKV